MFTQLFPVSFYLKEKNLSVTEKIRTLPEPSHQGSVHAWLFRLWPCLATCLESLAVPVGLLNLLKPIHPPHFKTTNNNFEPLFI